ncbi:MULTISPECIES: hypothetical protein [unclassified Chelatococcus]|uniref:hypothetical protein n=1 Tax=unclassified Chelatococcus TaxID=2638111 RepID=UPI001BD16BB2|nr:MULTISPECIES: hypothetical protein [unclassified Chelatococcus]CAH1665673.1 conserved hypothetical protein [Hyphomicrobiales bacterium]MBS7737753.1 hypothetical protein [Chelatococcus sp. HY11]MBX3547242.1 hypothetical protein [Chelatococcus sp.]MCO5077119.1 hypothetical protein [Chelatococcus sp.]CAH1681184.1 conserved hypothetical protein [Hyphomicrobiales bacterium]
MTVCGVGTHTHAARGDDFYATPREAVEALLAIESKWLPQGTIWEPACGDGAIVNVLRAKGHTVVATDLVDRGCPDSVGGLDFVRDGRYPGQGVTQAIVTNPPFKLAREFVERALHECGYVAMLLRLAFLEGTARRPWFEMRPLARVHVASRRLPMMHRHGWDGPKASSAVCHAWFIWDRRHEGRPVIQWFDWKDYAAANDNKSSERLCA